MAWIEVLPEAPSKTEPVEAVVPHQGFRRGPEPAAIAVLAPKPEPILDSQPGWWSGWLRDRARNKLQRTLARIIQISQDHESNGVVPGDRIYQSLYAKALDLCHGYFDQWHLNRDNIEIEIPCMRQLRLAAHPEAIITARKAPVALVGFLALVTLPLVAGAWCGLFGVGHVWIMHLFGG